MVEIDLGRESVQLFDPATYEAPRAHWEPLLLHWQVPFVSARFEGEIRRLRVEVKSREGDLAVLKAHMGGSHGPW